MSSTQVSYLTWLHYIYKEKYKYMYYCNVPTSFSKTITIYMYNYMLVIIMTFKNTAFSKITLTLSLLDWTKSAPYSSKESL